MIVRLTTATGRVYVNFQHVVFFKAGAGSPPGTTVTMTDGTNFAILETVDQIENALSGTSQQDFLLVSVR